VEQQQQQQQRPPSAAPAPSAASKSRGFKVKPLPGQAPQQDQAMNEAGSVQEGDEEEEEEEEAVEEAESGWETASDAGGPRCCW
jgi:hypothetical protein